jgi:hypothetical protein
VKHTPKLSKSPRDIIGDDNVTALKQAGFVVVSLSELSQLRANITSMLGILSNGTAQKELGRSNSSAAIRDGTTKLPLNDTLPTVLSVPRSERLPVAAL